MCTRTLLLIEVSIHVSVLCGSVMEPPITYHITAGRHCCWLLCTAWCKLVKGTVVNMMSPGIVHLCIRCTATGSPYSLPCLLDNRPPATLEKVKAAIPAVRHSLFVVLCTRPNAVACCSPLQHSWRPTSPSQYACNDAYLHSSKCDLTSACASEFPLLCAAE